MEKVAAKPTDEVGYKNFAVAETLTSKQFRKDDTVSQKNEKVVRISRVLRRNMTKEEKHLWYDFLKLLPVTVNRQKVIGQYVVDFYIASAKLVIELDGAQHFEKENKENDRIRDQALQEMGLAVFRYTNLDIHKRFDAVCREILSCLGLE